MVRIVTLEELKKLRKNHEAYNLDWLGWGCKAKIIERKTFSKNICVETFFKDGTSYVHFIEKDFVIEKNKRENKI